MSAKAKENTRSGLDFQAEADKYAHTSIGYLREMIEALEHAGECSGEVDCPKCNGSGKTATGKDCKKCESTGMVKCEMGKATDNPDAYHNEDTAREWIQEDPLSIEVRSDWHTPGSEGEKPTEYNILLGTGGPAARIIGDLDEYGQPESAHFEYQDWFKPWTRANTSYEEDDVMLKYAQQFYFSE